VPSNIDRKVASTDSKSLPNRGPWKNPGFNYKSCKKNTINGTTHPFDRNGVFNKKCAPEVLYTWQPKNMLYHYTSTTSENDLLFLERIFLWRTPMGSYGYGDAPIRIKLKKTVNFVELPYYHRQNALNAIGWYGKDARIETCNYWKKTLNAPDESIYVVTFGDKENWDSRGVHEYIMCDSSSIESWSVVSPEVLQEMQWEIDQVRDTHQKQADGFDLLIQNAGDPFNQRTQDADFSITHYQQSVEWMWKHLQKNKYTKIYARNEEDANREKHFSVTNPTYFLRREPGYLSEGETITDFSLVASGVKSVDLLSAKDLKDCVGKAVCDKVLDPDKFPKNTTYLTAKWKCTGENPERSQIFTTNTLFFFNGQYTDVTSSQVSIDCGPTSGIIIPEVIKPKIRVLSAFYGDASNQSDVTVPAAKFCDGKESCEYKISSRFLKVDFIKEATFSLEFICDNLKEPLRVDVPAPADRQTWVFGCDGTIKKLR
jgi:hypothetical protein